MKTMLMGMLVLLASASLAMGSLAWDFDDGTAQGWISVSNGGAAGVEADGSGGYQIYDHIEAGGGGNCGVQIIGLNEEVLSTEDYLELDTYISTPTPYAAYRVDLTTAESVGSYRYWIAGTGGTDLAVDLFNLELADGASALSVGDHVTGITVVVFGYSMNLTTDNVELVTTPEPTTMGLLGVGGLLTLLRRRKG